MTHNDDDFDFGLSEVFVIIATPFTITIELLKCLKLWFRFGIFTGQDLHAIIDIMKKEATEAMKNMKTAVD